MYFTFNEFIFFDFVIFPSALLFKISSDDSILFIDIALLLFGLFCISKLFFSSLLFDVFSDDIFFLIVLIFIFFSFSFFVLMLELSYSLLLSFIEVLNSSLFLISISPFFFDLFFHRFNYSHCVSPFLFYCSHSQN